MAEFIEIHWTSGSLDEARKISRYLIQEHYVACAQIIPWIESIFIWNGQLETGQESKVIMKTTLELYESVKKVILENCAYQVPEITFQSIDGGNAEYLDWLRQNTVKPQSMIMPQNN